ncbi:alcohol dehydrogenase [Prauserella marina]|uniref:hydroxyacid-oxoacid transhydrogenase n=1 Tax=Prauserella marina TaxID=530584 RepID=A0A222VL36_9PSEU|nr:hydroxyacid-oxoacid transhydrogenase [Prauserella marina]ASR34640.1 alcohol dehydrogenase [Prauserella marina]PWV85718.1 alcohol dehydrogenase class IV [Prauserella marina]SDC47455.1 Alcohol dehydrogenase, class IV [Prauserella marina]
MTAYQNETVFTWGATPLKFGAGAVDEIGWDLAGMGARRVLIVTDAGVAATGVPQRVADAAKAGGLTVEIYDQVHVEPTDESITAAVDFAGQSTWDGFIGVGGGSSIDTAKAINLMTSHPADLFDYVNKPIGKGLAPPGPLKPLVAVPTTAGTGSETTPVCVMDFLGLAVKSGISHPRLRPSMAVVDPLLTLSMPPEVTAASGMDVLCHALESYTAKPFHSFARHTPETRVAYNGSNPISDAWTEQALGLLARSFRRAVLNGGDLEARTDMMLAATFAGMGFGNAGVHVPHACAYPIAGRVKEYRPKNYPPEKALVPHGESVSLTAPAAFRFTFPSDPRKHLHAAEMLDPRAPKQADPREQLPAVLASLMRDIGIPNGIGGVGFTESDIPSLVEGTMQQQRLLAVAPRTVTEEDVSAILADSIENW